MADIITVSGVGIGEATVSIKVLEGNNYTETDVLNADIEVNEISYIYGVEWDGSATTKWTRTDDSKDFPDPNPAVNNGTGSSPFDDIMPWSGMIKEKHADCGTVVAIPKFYYKLSYVDEANQTGLKIQISNTLLEGFEIAPAHKARMYGGSESEVVYIGRYHCVNGYPNYMSNTNGSINDTITRSTARTEIHKLGPNIWQMDFAMLFTIWLLYLVEFADWNSQATIGYGSGRMSYSYTGYTDKMQYHTGTNLADRTTQGMGTQYRNIEGLWGNNFQWIDGCFYKKDGLRIILNPNNFQDGAYTAPNIGKPEPITGIPSKFEIVGSGSSDFFTMFLPVEAEGTDETYTTDSWLFNNLKPVIYSGGWRQYSMYNGLFYLNTESSSKTLESVGCRLMKF